MNANQAKGGTDSGNNQRGHQYDRLIRAVERELPHSSYLRRMEEVARRITASTHDKLRGKYGLPGATAMALRKLEAGLGMQVPSVDLALRGATPREYDERTLFGYPGLDDEQAAEQHNLLLDEYDAQRVRLGMLNSSYVQTQAEITARENALNLDRLREQYDNPDASYTDLIPLIERDFRAQLAHEAIDHSIE